MQATHSGNRRSLENYRDLLLVLFQKEFKIRYKNKVLGYVWSIANPLANAVIYFFAFSVIMGIREENYILFLITGLFAWQWFSNAVSSSPKLFVGNSLIKKIAFPRILIPLSAALNHMVHFILSIPVIILFLAIHHKVPSISWIWGIPVLLTVHLFMSLGLSLTFAALNLFLRDIERLVAILIHFTFYLTPILYSEDLIPADYKNYIYLNPVAPLVISWRKLFLDGTIVPMYMLASFGYALVFFGIGYFIYSKLSWKFAEVI